MPKSAENEGCNTFEQNSVQTPLPKHIPFPEIPNSSEILNEFIVFLFILFAAGMQFLHIYRTIWWLPDSYINHTINFYLIDPYLVIFITFMLSRRVLYCLMNQCLEIVYKDKQLKIHKIVAKYCYISVLILILGSCVSKIYTKQSYLSMFLLLYPLVVYSLVFGPKIEPFLRTVSEIEGTYLNGYPMHCCSSNPNIIRDEIETLKNDFNNRFKQAIFTSVVNAYYSGFVPCFFAQNFLYYDILWATQHIIFVWLGGFTMVTVFCFPAKYCDVLHRAALHLGQWSKMDRTGNMNLPPATWTKTVPWIQGSIVRHSGDLYRSMGPVTSATPGNTTHFRFYKLFNNPSVVYMVLTTIQIALVILQIFLLFFSIEWHNILSLSFLILTNHHTLFKIARDYLVAQKVYAAESSIYEKLSSHFN